VALGAIHEGYASVLARLRISGGGAKSDEHGLESFQVDIPNATTTQKTKSLPILPQSRTTMSPGVQTAGRRPRWFCCFDHRTVLHVDPAVVELEVCGLAQPRGLLDEWLIDHLCPVPVAHDPLPSIRECLVETWDLVSHQWPNQACFEPVAQRIQANR
jgi:hypothetical protein